MKSTRRGSDSPVHRREKTPRFQIPLDKWPVSPGTTREASGVLHEVAKHAILAGANFFGKFSAALDSLRPANAGALESILADAARVKVNVVNRDEYEARLRM